MERGVMMSVAVVGSSGKSYNFGIVFFPREKNQIRVQRERWKKLLNDKKKWEIKQGLS